MDKTALKEKLGDLLLKMANLGKRQFIFIVIFFLTNCFTYIMKMWTSGKGDLMISYLFTGLLWSYIVATVIDRACPKKIQKAVQYVVCGFSMLFFLVELTVFCQYKALIGAGVVTALAETNISESIEYVNNFLDPLIIFYIAIAGLIIYFFWKYRPWLLAQSDDISKKIIMGLLTPLCIGYAIMAFCYFPNYMIDDPLTPATRFLYAGNKAWENHKAYIELAGKIDSNVELTKNESNITNIVFILGESTNRNHMHLYGYPLPTTPNLDDMKAKNEIAVFADVVSPHSTTVAAMSKIFTFCDKESEKEWYEYHNLIDIMNVAGYKTHWLSNQETSGIWGSVAQILANHSSYSEFAQVRDSEEDDSNLDEKLFPIVDKAIATNMQGEKNFYVVHLMGAHIAYYNRYPYMFTKFSKADVPLGANDAQKNIIAQYDNAIYYNDYIVSGIIDKFRETNTDAIVIYLPDHGEAVYDEGSSNGHVEENPTRHMIEIPFIIWASDKFKQLHPEKWETIQEATDRPYMSDDMIHTIMDIAGIETVDWREDKSLINDSFDASRHRFFNDKDYDLEIKNQ